VKLASEGKGGPCKIGELCLDIEQKRSMKEGQQPNEADKVWAKADNRGTITKSISGGTRFRKKGKETTNLSQVTCQPNRSKWTIGEIRTGLTKGSGRVRPAKEPVGGTQRVLPMLQYI